MTDSTPICRCRVLYLGSAVPRQSKDGLQGIQEPLRSLYPSEGAVVAKGIDSWLSVWSNGILLENVDENLKQITRFFPIESLHYCAAVRQVLIPERRDTNPAPKFLPLDSPFARMPRAQHPPIFAAILRRTTGIKVLECHVFICKREAAANALVRCCFHAYADNSYARQLESGGDVAAGSSTYGTLKSAVSVGKNGEFLNGNIYNNQGFSSNRTASSTTLDSAGKQTNGNLHEPILIANSNNESFTSSKNYYDGTTDLNVIVDDETSIYNGDENHKVWNGSQDHLNGISVESPYEVFPGNTNTFGRPARVRQISAPIEVPPPPVKEESIKKKKDKKIRKSTGSQSLYGTLIRPKPIHPGAVPVGVNHGNHGNHGTPISYGHAMSPAFPPSRHFHTISHRGFSYGAHGTPVSYHMNVARQPPQASHFSRQVPVLLPQQYATLQPPRSAKKNKKEKKNNSIPVGLPIVPPIYAYHHNQAPHFAPSLISEPRSLANSNRRLAASLGNGLDDSGNSGPDSPSGTGIYKRKGHLNERAFSFSIRQEHRSRSHGSLASLQFNSPDLKKEREIAQMVEGLDLNDMPDHRSIDPDMQNGKHIVQAYKRGDRHENALYDNGGAANLYGNQPIITSKHWKKFNR